MYLGNFVTRRPLRSIIVFLFMFLVDSIYTYVIAKLFMVPHNDMNRTNLVCLAGAVANVTDSDRCCNPKVLSSIPAGGKNFP